MSVALHDTVSERLRRLIRNQLLSNSQVRVLWVSFSFYALLGAYMSKLSGFHLSSWSLFSISFPHRCSTASLSFSLHGATRTCPPSPKSQIIRFCLDPLLVDLVLGANFGFGPQFQKSNSLSCPGLTRNSPLYSFC